MAIIETWWAWVAFGIVLMLLELMMPSYLFLGFGFGAIVTGITLALGITMSAQYLMLLFAIASLISWFFCDRFSNSRKGTFKPLITISTTIEMGQRSRQRLTIV